MTNTENKLMKKEIFLVIVSLILITGIVGVFGQNLLQEGWTLPDHRANINGLVESGDPEKIKEFNEGWIKFDDKKKLEIWESYANDFPDNRKNLWDILSYEDGTNFVDNRKSLTDAFKTEPETEPANLKKLWDSVLEGKKLKELTDSDSDIFFNIDKLMDTIETRQKSLLMEEVIKENGNISPEIKLPDIEGLEVSFKQLKANTNNFAFEIKDPNGDRHTIPITNLPPVENIIFAELGGEYGVQYGFNKDKSKRAFLKGGTYLQWETPEGGYEEVIVVKDYGSVIDPVINFGDSKEAIFEVSKNQLQVWTPKGSLNPEETASFKIGSEEIFPHPKGPMWEGMSYASFNPLEGQDDVYKIIGAGRSSRDEGLGFYFKSEGVLDLTGEYSNNEDISILRAYKNEAGARIVEGTAVGGKPVTFTIGEDTNVIIDGKKLALNPKDSTDNYYQYLLTEEGLYKDREKEEYVGRLGEYSHSLASSNSPKADTTKRVGDITDTDGTPSSHLSDNLPGKPGEPDIFKEERSVEEQKPAEVVKPEDTKSPFKVETEPELTKNQPTTTTNNIKNTPIKNQNNFFTSDVGKYNGPSGNFNFKYTTRTHLRNLLQEGQTIDVRVSEPSWCPHCRKPQDPNINYITKFQGRIMGYEGGIPEDIKIKNINGRLILTE